MLSRKSASTKSKGPSPKSCGYAEGVSPKRSFQEGSAGRCSFSFDGHTWLEADEEGRGHSAVVGPLMHEPGWDFYEVATSSRASRGGVNLHVRRSAPIRLVRIYGQWPSTDSPLATALHPGGVKASEVVLPEDFRKLTRLLVAVCPPAASLKTPLSAGSPVSSPKRLSTPACISAAAAAVAAAEAEAEAAELELKTRSAGRPRVLHGMRSGAASPAASDKVSTSSGSSSTRAGTSSGSSSTPRDASAILSQLFQEEVFLEAVKAETSKAADADTVTSLKEEVRALRQELEDERRARSEAEDEAAESTLQVSRLREECSSLLQRLRTAERATMASEMQVRQLMSSQADAVQKASQRGPWTVKSVDEVVAALVTLELKQLSACSAEERAATKRKLLLKWHPDKNASSGGCNDLAKRMVQEMQANPEWN